MINMPKLPNVKGLVALGKNLAMAHRPELLFGASIVSTLGAVGLAAKGGYDAGVEVERHENTNGVILEPKEKAKMIAPHFIPAAAATIGALGSTTGLHIVHVKEKKQLAAAALMAIEEVKTEANEYAERVKEIVNDDDKKPAEKVKELKEIPNSDGEVEELYLVRDNFSGRDIWSNEQRIADAVNSVNEWLNKNGDVELNHFYSVAGFGHLPLGDDVGWSGDFIELRWDTTTRDDGRPVRRFTFLAEPRKGYDSVTN